MRQTRHYRTICVSLLLLFAAGIVRAAPVTVFTDTFTRSTNPETVLGNGWAWAANNGEARLIDPPLGPQDPPISDVMELVRPSSGTGVGQVWAYHSTSSFTGPWSSQLGRRDATWYFNIHETENLVTDFTTGSNNYAAAFVLSGSTANFLTGSGYAVVLADVPPEVGGPSLRLVSYTGGLDGTVNTLVSSTGAGPYPSGGAQLSDFWAGRVDYDHLTHQWTLSADLQNLANGGFPDPQTVSYILGSNVDNSYVGPGYSNFIGGIWNHGPATGNQHYALFDTIIMEATPEPASMGLMTLGLISVLLYQRRRRRG